jgi:hypothetical protein
VPEQKFSFNSPGYVLLELLGKRNLISQDLQLHPVQQFDALVQAPTFFLYG